MGSVSPGASRWRRARPAATGRRRSRPPRSPPRRSGRRGSGGGCPRGSPRACTRPGHVEVELHRAESRGGGVPAQHLLLGEVARRTHGIRNGPGREVRQPPVEHEEGEVGAGVAQRRHLPVDDGGHLVGVVREDVVEPVVPVHDPRSARLAGALHPGREPVGKLVGRGPLGREGLLHLPAPPADLSGEEPLGSPEVREADLPRIDGVQGGKGVDHPFADRAGPLRAERRQLSGRPVRGALDVRHDVERGTEHVIVVDERERLRNRNVCGPERGDDGVLAGHVVRGGEDVPERRAAHDPGALAVPDAVGEVGLASGDEDAGERAGERGRRVVAEGGSPPRRERGRVQARCVPIDVATLCGLRGLGGLGCLGVLGGLGPTGAHGMSTLRTSATQPGLSCPSTSTVTLVRSWNPPPPGSSANTSTPARTREPTGTGAGNRTLSLP